MAVICVTSVSVSQSMCWRLLFNRFSCFRISTLTSLDESLGAVIRGANPWLYNYEMFYGYNNDDNNDDDDDDNDDEKDKKKMMM